MQSDTAMRVDRRRWLLWLPIALVFLGIAASFVWTYVSIELRLSRNGAIVNRLVESLHARFPGTNFSGAASYESEVIYITVITHVDESTRRDVEQWLRGQKAEQKLAPEIWLRFWNHASDDDNIIKI